VSRGTNCADADWRRLIDESVFETMTRGPLRFVPSGGGDSSAPLSVVGRTSGDSPAPLSAVVGRAESLHCSRVVHVIGLDSEAVVGIAFASFVIGIILTAAIWFIYVRTGWLWSRDLAMRALLFVRCIWFGRIQFLIKLYFTSEEYNC